MDRIADRQRQHLAEGAEFFLVRALAGDEFLGHARGAHQTPFVVVARQPQLGDIAEGLARGDFALLQVRVVIDDRQVRRHFVIQLAGCFRGE